MLNEERVFLSQRTSHVDRDNLQGLLSLMGSTFRYLNARYTLVRIFIFLYAKAINPLNSRAMFCKLCCKLLTQLTQRRAKENKLFSLILNFLLFAFSSSDKKVVLFNDCYRIVIQRRLELLLQLVYVDRICL